MVDSANGGPQQVELIGPYAGVFTYVLGAGLMLVGPLVAVAGDSWAGGLCSGVVTLPIGLGLLVSTYGWRRTERNFQAVGVPGIAEVRSVDKIHPGGENPDTADLTIRITGSAFETFTAVCSLDHHAGLSVGHTFSVIVDPADNSFAIGYDHLFPGPDTDGTPTV